LRTNQSGTTDLRAEELVRSDRGTAFLAVDDGDRRERRSAPLAATQQLSAALRAGFRKLRFELLEPPARRAATETESNPVPEDLTTLLPQPVRRFRHVLTLAVVVVAAAGCGGGPRYHSTQGARLVHYTLKSRLVHADLHEIRVVPRRHGDWVLVLLHGKGGGPTQFLSQPFFDTLEALGGRAPVVLLLDGGDDSYWHNRADGAWASMVLDEAIPRRGRLAIGGISMGGYGALLLGSRDRRFCAVGVQSPALWTSPGATAPGAFDNSEDYERNDVFKLRAPHPLWIDLGAGDPFHAATLTYARRAGVHAHVSPGGHDVAFWDAHTPQFLRFFSRACA
jgi:Putative esterase